MTATAAASLATTTSMTPFGACMSTGPMSSGRTSPSPPPAIIAGPPMPIEASDVATMRSEQPTITALPAKHRPLTTAIRGTRPLSLAHSANARVCSHETAGKSVSPGRPPPPSAKSTTGRRIRSMSSNSRSFFACPSIPCVPARTV